MIECENCGRDTPQALFEQPHGKQWRAKCNVCHHITVRDYSPLGFLPTPLAAAVKAAENDQCPKCGGELDTGWECNKCSYDAKPLIKPRN